MVIGAEGLPVAVFIYKGDGSAAAAWQSVEAIVKREGPVRGELHRSKVPFLQALEAWNRSVDPVESFLCIYSHAGESGIAPVQAPNASELIRWDELREALPRGVRYLWLLGCETEHAHKAWANQPVPVAHHCLSTISSVYWQPFIEFFAREISVEEILSSDELMAKLSADNPVLANNTQYSTNAKWTPR